MNTSLTQYLTPLGRREARLRLSLILSHIEKAAKKDPNKEFLKLERKLAAELIKNWRESYTDALKQIFSGMPDLGNKKLAKKISKTIENGLTEALGEAYGSSKKIQKLVKDYIKEAYSTSKAQSSGSLKSSLSLPDEKAIDVLTRHNCFWIGEHYGKHVSPKIAELTQKALDEGLGRDALAESLRQELGGAAPEGYSYWDVVSSSALVRARSFGSISGFEEAGITEYEILAMGDERMCPICGEMNGKIFSVAETREVIDRVLDIKAPEKFKEAMPWQTKPPTKQSNFKLEISGQSIPPFHGRCRCTLIMVQESGLPEAKTIKEANEIAVKYGIADKADFTGLHISAANELNRGVWETQRLFPELEKFEFVGSCQRHNHETWMLDVKREAERIRAMLPCESEEILLQLAKQRTPVYRTPPSTDAFSREKAGVKGISLNAKFMSKKGIENYKRLILVESVQSSFHPIGCDTIKSIVDHEMGHKISVLVNAKDDKEIIAWYNELIKSGKMKEALSEYPAYKHNQEGAEVGIGEFIAEAWSEYMNNKTPRSIAKKVAEKLIKLARRDT